MTFKTSGDFARRHFRFILMLLMALFVIVLSESPVRWSQFMSAFVIGPISDYCSAAWYKIIEFGTKSILAQVLAFLSF